MKYFLVMLCGVWVAQAAMYANAQSHTHLGSTYIFTVASLRDGMAGKPMMHYGRAFDGDSAFVFTQGYIGALAEAGDANGSWCGMRTMKPHTVQSAVFEKLVESKPTVPAAIAVAAALKSLHPCPPKVKKAA
jgi:hypothetical protein